jgi:hypothetical protein
MCRADLSSRGSRSVAFHPKFKDNGYVHYASIPFNGASSPRDNSAMIFELQSGEVETPVVKN